MNSTISEQFGAESIPTSPPVSSLPAHFSPSSIGTYLECPRAYFYKYFCKLKLPSKSVHLLFGSAVHAAIEHISSEDPMKYFRNEFNLELLDPSEREDYDNLVPVGERIIELYKEHKDYLHQVLDVSQGGTPEIWAKGVLENPLTGERLVIPMVGKIDHLTDNKKVKEYKTSKNYYKMDDELFRLQTKLYALWYWMTYREVPKGIVYFVFPKQMKLLESEKPIQAFELIYSVEELAEAFEQVKGLLIQIEQKQFNRGRHKPYCDCLKFDKLLLVEKQ